MGLRSSMHRRSAVEQKCSMHGVLHMKSWMQHLPCNLCKALQALASTADVWANSTTFFV